MKGNSKKKNRKKINRSISRPIIHSRVKQASYGRSARPSRGNRSRCGALSRWDQSMLDRLVTGSALNEVVEELSKKARPPSPIAAFHLPPPSSFFWSPPRLPSCHRIPLLPTPPVQNAIFRGLSSRSCIAVANGIYHCEGVGVMYVLAGASSREKSVSKAHCACRILYGV